MPAKLRCLFLGDSYTAGTAVPGKLRWPAQLTDRMKDMGLDVEPPRFIAGNGWTTEDLIEALDAQNPEPHFDLVFLMIGVNNQFNGRPFVDFQVQFSVLINRAIELARGCVDRVFALAVPDYSVTPFAADRNPAMIASNIGLYNSECVKISQRLGVEFLDTVEISRQAGTNRALLISDGLHPSEDMYRLWSNFIFDRLRPDFDVLPKI